MLGYIIRRVLWIIPVLFFVSVITFTMMHAAPGGPWAREKHLLPTRSRLLNLKYGLDDPISDPVPQVGGQASSATSGPSYNPGPDRQRHRRRRHRHHRPPGGDGLPAVGGVGIPLGVIGALRHNKLPDYVATFISVIGIATPSFVASILLLVFFSVLCAGSRRTAGTAGPSQARWSCRRWRWRSSRSRRSRRFTRASMLEVTRKDYVRTAQSKGLKERTIVVIHMIRNALIPVVTILGPLLAFLITGSFIIETIFSVPGHRPLLRDQHRPARLRCDHGDDHAVRCRDRHPEPGGRRAVRLHRSSHSLQLGARTDGQPTGPRSDRRSRARSASLWGDAFGA